MLIAISIKILKHFVLGPKVGVGQVQDQLDENLESGPQSV